VERINTAVSPNRNGVASRVGRALLGAFLCAFFTSLIILGAILLGIVVVARVIAGVFAGQSPAETTRPMESNTPEKHHLAFSMSTETQQHDILHTALDRPCLAGR
jgi:hypothetical protein